MIALRDQITALKGEDHGSPDSFINKEDVQQPKTRMICQKLVSPRNQQKFISCRKAFKSLADLQNTNIDIAYVCKASLWQKFKSSLAQIIELLNHLEHHMEEFINSILENDLMSQLRNEFLDKDISKAKVQSLQLLLNKQVESKIGQHQFTSGTSIQKQSGFIQSNGILKVQKQAIKLLNCHLDAIWKKTIQMEQDYKSQLVGRQYHPFEPIQTLSIGGSCRCVCLNHNETEMAAINGNSIIIYNLSRNGQWKKCDQLQFNPTNLVFQLKFSHDSKQLVVMHQSKYGQLTSQKFGSAIIP